MLTASSTWPGNPSAIGGPVYGYTGPPVRAYGLGLAYQLLESLSREQRPATRNSCLACFCLPFHQSEWFLELVPLVDALSLVGSRGQPAWCRFHADGASGRTVLRPGRSAVQVTTCCDQLNQPWPISQGPIPAGESTRVEKGAERKPWPCGLIGNVGMLLGENQVFRHRYGSWPHHRGTAVRVRGGPPARAELDASIAVTSSWWPPHRCGHATSEWLPGGTAAA